MHTQARAPRVDIRFEHFENYLNQTDKQIVCEQLRLLKKRQEKAFLYN